MQYTINRQKNQLYSTYNYRNANIKKLSSIETRQRDSNCLSTNRKTVTLSVHDAVAMTGDCIRVAELYCS
jgi:hypothetical protein